MKILLITLLFCSLLVVGCATMTQEKEIQHVEGEKTAIFAGGCFWCMEAPFEAEPGVIDAVVGYIGGSEETADYKTVSSGTTQHREGIKVTYDPNVVSYEKLVQIYFWQINPTDPEGQFADKGYQYTTAIYYTDEEQKKLAEKHIADLEASKKFDRPIVTEVLVAKPFYLAEDYHQNYYQKQSAHYNTYSVLSGRKGFIKKVWGGEKDE